MKIYTKTGDNGDTSLFGGGRVSKNSLRIEAYGTVDELNSIIGLARSFGLTEEGERLCETIQNDLFVLGADLATPPGSRVKIDRITHDHVIRMEHFIDGLEDTLPKLRFFILPGGTQAASSLHMARTVCRRAERKTVQARIEEDISDDCIHYLNRLSDLLFVMARYENHQSGGTENVWKATT